MSEWFKFGQVDVFFLEIWNLNSPKYMCKFLNNWIYATKFLILQAWNISFFGQTRYIKHFLRIFSLEHRILFLLFQISLFNLLLRLLFYMHLQLKFHLKLFPFTLLILLRGFKVAKVLLFDQNRNSISWKNNHLLFEKKKTKDVFPILEVKKVTYIDSGFESILTARKIFW